MRTASACLSILAFLLSTVSVLAQPDGGTVARIALFRAKEGMKDEMERGIKKHMEWHRKKNDSWAWLTWVVVSGENTGMYGGGTFGHAWADFDNPSVPEDEDQADADSNVRPYIDDVEVRYYSHLPEVSRLEGAEEAAMNAIITFQVRFGMDRQFNHLIRKFHEAIGRTDWPIRYGWYVLVNGGMAGEYLLVLPRNDWADFAPFEKPFAQMLEEAYGRAEAESLLDAWRETVRGSKSEIIANRPDLSYVPGSKD